MFRLQLFLLLSFNRKARKCGKNFGFNFVCVVICNFFISAVFFLMFCLSVYFTFYKFTFRLFSYYSCAAINTSLFIFYKKRWKKLFSCNKSCNKKIQVDILIYIKKNTLSNSSFLTIIIPSMYDGEVKHRKKKTRKYFINILTLMVVILWKKGYFFPDLLYLLIVFSCFI